VRVLVFGAGPLGSLMTARLHEAGHDVSLLARGQRLDDLKTHGVVLRDEESGEQEVAHVPVVEALGPDDHYDLVMVVMRKNQVQDILPVLAANPHVPSYLFLMNNAEGPAPLLDALGADRVLLGFPLPGGSREGHVVHIVPVDEDHTYTVPIGEVDGQVRDRTRAVADLLGSMRGYEVEIRDDMDAWLKYHACVTILGLGPAVCAAGIDMERLARTRDLMILSLRAMREGLRGLRKDLETPPAPRSFRLLELLPEPIWVWLLRSQLRKGKARSSIEGHSAAARDEIEHVAEELLSQLHAAGVSTPAIDRLLPHADPATPTWPDGARDIPMRWGGVVVPLLAVAAIAATAVARLVPPVRTSNRIDSQEGIRHGQSSDRARAPGARPGR
jgi:ketopantoate reductase